MIGLSGLIAQFVYYQDYTHYAYSVYIRSFFGLFLFARLSDPLCLALNSIVLIGLPPSIRTLIRERARPEGWSLKRIRLSSQPIAVASQFRGLRSVQEAGCTAREEFVMTRYERLLAVCLLAFVMLGCTEQAAAPTATPTQPVTLGSPTPAAPTPVPELPTPTPELPVQIAEVGFNDALGSPHEVFVSGDYAYIADSFNGLRVVDISDRANPQQVGFFDPTGSTAGLGVYFSDPYVYLADGLGLLILDISDPTAPLETGFYDSPGFAVKVQLSGGYAYVAGREGGLNIADISDPANPQHVSNYFEAGSVHVLDVYVSGSYAYIAMQGLGLRVVDVSDPANPQEVGFSDTAGAAEAVYVSGSYAYLADGEDGLRIFDISNPVDPQETGFYDTPGYAQDVYLSGTYAFVGDGASRLLLVMDVSDPANPQLAGEYETPGFVWGIYISDSYAYVANGEHGMLVLRLEFE